MLGKKIVLTLLCTSLIGVTLNAKEHDNHQDNKNHKKKKKNMTNKKIYLLVYKKN
ncbi:MAG: hypothetical protein U5K55_08630 [Aliarcobacter sp.]|nr:hypothetical protein [Aliarcobacter sp.]